MKSLVGKANAIRPVVALGTLYRRPDGKMSMEYWRDGGFGAHRFAEEELPAAYVNPPRETLQASLEELFSDPLRPYEALMTFSGMQRVVLTPVPDVEPAITFWVDLAQADPVSPAMLGAFEQLAAQAARLLQTSEPTVEHGRLRRLAAVGELVPALLDVLDVREVFDHVSSTARTVLPHDALGMVLMSDDWQEVTFHAFSAPGVTEKLDVVPQAYPAPMLKIWDFHVHDDLSTNPRERELPLCRLGFRSLLWLPIRSKDQLVGGVVFATKAPSAYTAIDAEVGRRISDHLAVSLSHYRLAERQRRTAALEERTANLQALDGLLATLTGVLDVREVFERVSDIADSVIEHDAMSISVREQDRIRMYASRGLGHMPTPFEMPLPHPSIVSDQWEYELIEDLPASRFHSAHVGFNAGMRSVLIIPVRLQGELVASVNFFSKRNGRFTKDDTLIGRRIADHIALALSHQRMAEESRRSAALLERTSNLQMLEGLLSTLTGVLDIREVFDRVSEISQRVLPHDAVSVAELLPGGERVRLYASAGLGIPMPYERPIPQRQMLTEHWDFRLIDDVFDLPEFSDSPAVAAGMHSVLIVPVRIEGKLSGALAFYGKGIGRFTADDVLVAKRIGDHITLAMSHHRLAEEIREAEELRSRTSNLELLDHLLAAVTDAGELNDVIDRISDVAQKVLSHDAMVIPVLMADGAHVRFHVTRTPNAAKFPPVVKVPEHLRNSEWEFDLVDDLQADPAQRELAPAKLGYRSALRVPIRVDGQLAAGVGFFSFAAGVYKPTDVLVARRVADRLTVSLMKEKGLEADKRADEATARASRLESRVKALTEELDARTGYRRVVGGAPLWKRALTQATQVAPTDTTALLLGESGTGKEVLARLIHRASSRKDGPFIALNCAALPEQLLEAELFGYERGAFTGATQTKPGQLEQAAGGTLFLDEVAEMSPSAQAKFLRVLQEREFQRLGGTRVLRTDARVVAATNRDLLQAISRGQFREDLYYRLNVFAIHLPPLRDRKDDVLPLSEAFLGEISKNLGRPPAGISREARDSLVAYHWPGNVRELRNILERAAILCEGGLVLSEHLAIAVPSPQPKPATAVLPPIHFAEPASDGPPAQAVSGDLKSMERQMIEKALQDARFNKSKAAQILGLTRSQLYVRMKRYGLD